MADAPDLGSGGETRGGSSPPFRTILLALLLAVLALGLLLPIWLVPYPPLLDYPNHLARTFVLTHLHDPAYHLSRWYHSEWGPYPYLGMDFILIALQQFLPAEIAGKTFLSLVALLVPLSVWWFVRNANPGNDALSLFGLILGHGPYFLYGFESSQLGLAFCFFTVGMWLRYLDRPSPKRWLLLLLLATCTYFSHLIAFILAGFVVFVYALASRRSFRELVLAGVPFLPGVLMYFVGSIGYGGDLSFRDWHEKIEEGWSALCHSYSDALGTIVLVGVLLAVGIAFIRNREFRFRWRWAIVFAALFALYCVLPNEVGEAWEIDTRVIPVLFVVLLAVAAVGRRGRILALIALALFAARTVDVTQGFLDKQDFLLPMARGIQSIAPGSRVLPLINENDEEDMLDRLYVHFWAYSVIERRAFAPYLFDLKGQMALRTTKTIYIPERPLKDVDWAAVRRDYDYVWVYNFPDWKDNLNTIGSPVYSAGMLSIYRVDRTR